uniref:SEFIR domain-containing protein n=1 Tax=Amphiprion percula TaxID=161767 RepID=A0A3P8T1F2_AMPPE
MMWAFILIFSSCVTAQVASQEIKAECEEFQGYGFPPVSTDAAPSSLADLKVELVTVGGRNMLNISWAINIDSSICHLNGTRIMISGEPEYRCEYNPPLAQIQRFESQQKWFHYLVKASHGFCDIQAANLPLPPLGSGSPYKDASLEIPRPRATFPSVMPKSTEFSKAITPEPTPPGLKTKDVIVAVFGSLAGLVILSSCYLIYKNFGLNVATSLGFQNLPEAVPVPVLVVYPAENSAFQRAVVALAEFLQWHGGCSVAFDMWHQGKVAELGPMRWLAEQVKAADLVLIVCPGVETTVQCPPHHSFPEPSIPAAACDLYPLVLNMVASHAKSADELAKFWVVQLGERQDKKPSTLALELRTCRTFRLMKDLKKLCKGLHAARRSDRKISDLLLRPGFSYSEKSTEKLTEAVEMLRGNQTRSSKETQPLRSVISTV